MTHPTGLSSARLIRFRNPYVAARKADSMNSSIIERLRRAGRLDRIFGGGEWVAPETQARSSVVDSSTEEPAMEIALGGQEMSPWDHTAARVRAGQVQINYPTWNPQAPFGGYKRSANSREHRVEGLEEDLETKAILGFQDASAPSAD